jgi:hypothetical protein
MLFRQRKLDTRAIFQLGSVFLIVASLWKWFARPNPFLSQNAVDGIGGLLYGLTIGCYLWALSRRARGTASE